MASLEKPEALATSLLFSWPLTGRTSPLNQDKYFLSNLSQSPSHLHFAHLVTHLALGSMWIRTGFYAFPGTRGLVQTSALWGGSRSSWAIISLLPQDVWDIIINPHFILITILSNGYCYFPHFTQKLNCQSETTQQASSQDLSWDNLAPKSKDI